MTNQEKNQVYNEYLLIALNQGWDDPVGFAARRMREVEAEEQYQKDWPQNDAHVRARDLELNDDSFANWFFAETVK